MEARYEKAVTVLPGMVDSTGRLGVADTFCLFMDVATEAAGAMGVGWETLMRQGMFWITVKTRVRFMKRPALLDGIRVETWPQAPDQWRCNRHYRISRGGEALVLGKTEWAIVNVGTGQVRAMADVLPPDFPYPDEEACPGPFPMIGGDFAEPPYAVHRVVATDIDMARHMNNVAYVRAIVNSFSLRQWEDMGVEQMDVIFLGQAHEGDELRLQKRAGEGFVDVRGSLPGGGTAVLARLGLGAGRR